MQQCDDRGENDRETLSWPTHRLLSLSLSLSLTYISSRETKKAYMQSQSMLVGMHNTLLASIVRSMIRCMPVSHRVPFVVVIVIDIDHHHH